MDRLNKSNLLIFNGKMKKDKTILAKEKAKNAFDEGNMVYVFDCYEEYADLIQYASIDKAKKHAMAVYTGFEYTSALEYLALVQETETVKKDHMKSYLIIEGFEDLVEQKNQMEFFRILDKLTRQNVEVLIIIQDLEKWIEPTLLPWVLEKSRVSDFN